MMSLIAMRRMRRTVVSQINLLSERYTKQTTQKSLQKAIIGLQYNKSVRLLFTARQPWCFTQRFRHFTLHVASNRK